MLCSGNNLLPVGPITYAAFRIAFLETLERIGLADQIGMCTHRCFGYLTQVPFLRHVAPQVQLELLLETWARQESPTVQTASLLDEAIIYAAAETSAHLVRCDRVAVQLCLARGPIEVDQPINRELADAFQKLHLEFDAEPGFLLLTQYQDLAPEVADQYRAKHGLTLGRCDGIFDALSRWHVTLPFSVSVDGLLTPSEVEKAERVLQRKPATGSQL